MGALVQERRVLYLQWRKHLTNSRVDTWISHHGIDVSSRSALNRDLYFMNLGYIDSDSELFQAFATVPPNSIIVFEDVDTMTDVSLQSLSPFVIKS